MTDEKTINMLISLAKAARAASYSPYSGISVGAALLTKSGKIYTGANIESASYSPTVCAERVAFFKAINDGEREFSAIAVMGGENNEVENQPFYPCGVCRQVMTEFCNEDFLIIVSDNEIITKKTLGELMPNGFTIPR